MKDKAEVISITINDAFVAYRRISNRPIDMCCIFQNMIRRTKRVMEFRYDHQVLISNEIPPEEKYREVDLPTDIEYEVASNAITKVSSNGTYKITLL